MDSTNPVTLVSTYIGFREFLDSSIWLDLKNEVLVWIDQIREHQDDSDSPEELFRCQGRIEACKYFLSLPDTIIQAFEAQMEERKNGRE